MATLGRAIAIAAEAHEGQEDKAGEAYILHPLRLMLENPTERDRQRLARYEEALAILNSSGPEARR